MDHDGVVVPTQTITIKWFDVGFTKVYLFTSVSLSSPELDRLVRERKWESKRDSKGQVEEQWSINRYINNGNHTRTFSPAQVVSPCTPEETVMVK